MARENPRWGYLRIRGELLKLGVRVSATSIRAVLRRHGLGPAPRRDGPTWKEFLSQQASGILAWDFFTVKTVWLTTLYVFFFIELSTRRAYLGGVGAHPDSAWVTQQARNLAFDGRIGNVRFLIRDRDAKYSSPFDEVFRTEGLRIIKTPIRSPRANAFAERWMRTARRECLDHVLILRRRHLERVIGEFVGHYNAERPHRGLQLACPSPGWSSSPPGTSGGSTGVVRRRDRLGGLIHEYCLEAGMTPDMYTPQASAKIRSGAPKDDEEDLSDPVWAGVLPLRLLAQEPMTDRGVPLHVAVPDYVRHHWLRNDGHAAPR
jgi:transposase InsO family protein